MTLSDYYNRNLPDYYPTMYLDGYEPWQIMQAFRNIQRKKDREKEQSILEKQVFNFIEKTMEATVNQAMTDIFKDFLK